MPHRLHAAAPDCMPLQEQCNKLRREMECLSHSLELELIVVSPLTRTLQAPAPAPPRGALRFPSSHMLMRSPAQARRPGGCVS